MTQGQAMELEGRPGDFGLVITQRPFRGPFGSHHKLISFLIAPKTY